MLLAVAAGSPLVESVLTGNVRHPAGSLRHNGRYVVPTREQAPVLQNHQSRSTSHGSLLLHAAAVPLLAVARRRRRQNRDTQHQFLTRSGYANRGVLVSRSAGLGEVYAAAPLSTDGEALVVWLHGLGDTGLGWSNTAPALQRMGLPMLHFLFPTAPIRDAGTSRGPCPSWFDVPSLNPDDIAQLDESPAGLLDSVQLVLDLIEPHVRRGVPPSRVILVGYSQGGGLALATALRAPRKVGGVLMLSSWVAEPLPSACPSLDVHLFHGTADPVVPVASSKIGEGMLSAVGMRTTFHMFDGMGHTVCDQEVEEIAQTLYSVLR